MEYMEGEPHLPPDANNMAYVNDQYRDALAELEYRISVLKQDLSEQFPADCKARLQVLLDAYRLAWEHIQNEGGG